MKSPLTGKVMIRQHERKEFTYRKEMFSIIYQYYLCKDTEERFTDEELDSLNLRQVHNQYRAKYGVPFVDEIKALRSRYSLSAAKMSEVLGLGANVYRQYEAGEMPTVANGRLIRLCEDPLEFRKILQLSLNVFDTHDFERVEKRLDHSMQSGFNDYIEQYLFASRRPDIFNGYRVPSLERAGNMIRFFSYHNKPFSTAMNKLMFYADFGHYKRYGNSISGITYKAFQRGPVPSNYGSLYDQVVNAGLAEIREIDFEEYVGTRFFSKVTVEATCFSDSELLLLKSVSDRFKNFTTKQIVNLSHTEKGWQHNADDTGRISYEYSFELKHLE